MRLAQAPWAAGQSAVQEGLSDPSASLYSICLLCERGWHGGGPEPQGPGALVRGLQPWAVRATGVFPPQGLPASWMMWVLGWQGVVQGPEEGDKPLPSFRGLRKCRDSHPRELMEGVESCGGGHGGKVASEVTCRRVGRVSRWPGGEGSTNVLCT